MQNRLIPPLASLTLMFSLLHPALASDARIAAGETLRIALDAAPGDYIEGSLRLDSPGATLELVDARNQAQRRLVKSAGQQESFRFVAERNHAAFRLSSPNDSGYSLRITRRIAQRDQHASVEALASPTLQSLAEELAAGGNTAAFWARMAREGTPLIEAAGDGEYLVSFVWRGARHGVRLFGGPANDHLALRRLGKSDLWFSTVKVPATTRASYQLAPDVPEFAGPARERRVAILATAQADPLNPRSGPEDAPDRFSRDSILELPEAPAQPGLAPTEAPAGSLTRWEQASEALGNRREIVLYRPAGFSPDHPDNLLLFVFDGPEYRSKVPTPQILDRLIAAGQLPPVVAVFIANPDAAARARELPGNPAFARFMARELLPRVLAETGMPANASRTILAGSSYGGFAAATVALRHPDQFGNILSLSGSFWWSPEGTLAERQEYVAGLVARQAHLPARVFLSAGLFETAPVGSASILHSNRHLRDLFEARGVPVSYREYAGGHDYLVWRGALGDGLLALFGRPVLP